MLAHELRFVSMDEFGRTIRREREFTFKLPRGRRLTRRGDVLRLDGVRLAPLDDALRAEVERWPRVFPAELEPLLVARSPRDEWIVVARQVNEIGERFRVFQGHAPLLQERRVVNRYAGLDGGSMTFLLDVDGRVLSFHFPPPQCAIKSGCVPTLSMGREQLEVLQPVTGPLPKSLRFSCLEPLPADAARWRWPTFMKLE